MSRQNVTLAVFRCSTPESGFRTIHLGYQVSENRVADFHSALRKTIDAASASQEPRSTMPVEYFSPFGESAWVKPLSRAKPKYPTLPAIKIRGHGLHRLMPRASATRPRKPDAPACALAQASIVFATPHGEVVAALSAWPRVV